MMKRRSIRAFCLTFFLCAAFPGCVPVPAQEPPEQPAAPEFPGIEQVVPRAAQVARDASETKNEIFLLAATASFEDRLAGRVRRFEDQKGRFPGLEDLESWPVGKLIELEVRLEEHNRVLESLLSDISMPLERVEKIRRLWSERKVFWEGWLSDLQSKKEKVPLEAFGQAQKDISAVLDAAGSASQGLVALQQKVTARQGDINVLFSRTRTVLGDLRRDLFSRNARPLLSREYYSLLGPSIWTEAARGVTRVELSTSDFLDRNAWALVVGALAGTGLSLLIFRNRRRMQTVEEWNFLSSHPYWCGLLAAALVSYFLLVSPPPAWSLIVYVTGTVSATALILAVLPTKQQKSFLIAFVSAFVATSVMKMFSLPFALYRLYVTVLSLSGAGLFLVERRKTIRERQGQGGPLAFFLGLFALAFFLAAAAQTAGYATLGTRIFEASIQSVLAAYIIVVSLQFGDGLIAHTLAHPAIRESVFVRSLGSVTERRLEAIFRIVAFPFTALWLLSIWEIYESVRKAWDGIMGFTYVVGGFTFSVSTAVTVAAVVYGTVLFSWVLRAFLDSQVFPRRHVSRGVGEAFKTLLHYGLILVGLTVAVSMSGVDMRQFAILAGALGVGIGFGLQNIVNNFLSGLILLFERPVKVGDTVVIGGEWGTISRIGLRSTVVETWDRAEVIVPNSEMISEKVTNWTFSSRITRVVLPVGVSYGSDLEKVLAILLEVASGHPSALRRPVPSAIFTGFGESSLNFEVRVWVGDIDKRLTLRSEVGQRIIQRFRDEGIEIPFPQRDLHLRTADPKARITVEGPKED